MADAWNASRLGVDTRPPDVPLSAAMVTEHSARVPRHPHQHCTNGIWLMTRINPEHVPCSWKIPLSGHVPEYLYQHGRLDTSINEASTRTRAHGYRVAQEFRGATDMAGLGCDPARGGRLGSYLTCSSTS